jgi:hypothetical protein
MNFHATRFFPVPAGNGLHLEKKGVKILFLFENLGPSGGFRRPSGAARETIQWSSHLQLSDPLGKRKNQAQGQH